MNIKFIFLFRTFKLHLYTPSVRCHHRAMFVSKYLLAKKDKEPSCNIEKSLFNNCKNYRL